MTERSRNERAQEAFWAREWAHGPSGAAAVSPYVSHVANGTGREEAGTGGDTAERASQ